MGETPAGVSEQQPVSWCTELGRCCRGVALSVQCLHRGAQKINLQGGGAEGQAHRWSQVAAALEVLEHAGAGGWGTVRR